MSIQPFIGPKELPRVMHQVRQAAAKMRRIAAEFRNQFMVMREAEIDDIKPMWKGSWKARRPTLG
jgi:Sec-independent protein translocase protein TatA